MLSGQCVKWWFELCVNDRGENKLYVREEDFFGHGVLCKFILVCPPIVTKTEFNLKKLVLTSTHPKNVYWN